MAVVLLPLLPSCRSWVLTLLLSSSLSPPLFVWQDLFPSSGPWQRQWAFSVKSEAAAAPLLLRGFLPAATIHTAAESPQSSWQVNVVLTRFRECVRNCTVRGRHPGWVTEPLWPAHMHGAQSERERGGGRGREVFSGRARAHTQTRTLMRRRKAEVEGQVGFSFGFYVKRWDKGWIRVHAHRHAPTRTYGMGNCKVVVTQKNPTQHNPELAHVSTAWSGCGASLRHRRLQAFKTHTNTNTQKQCGKTHVWPPMCVWLCATLLHNIIFLHNPNSPLSPPPHSLLIHHASRLHPNSSCSWTTRTRSVVLCVARKKRAWHENARGRIPPPGEETHTHKHTNTHTHTQNSPRVWTQVLPVRL